MSVTLDTPFGRHLRLLPQTAPASADAPHELAAQRQPPRRPELRGLTGGPQRVLVAGGDSRARATLCQELGATMPSSTAFEQASHASDVMAHASFSRMVVLAGDLDDTSADSLVRALGHRHPALPVITLSACDAGIRPRGARSLCR
jgi:hypothetical protein